MLYTKWICHSVVIPLRGNEMQMMKRQLFWMLKLDIEFLRTYVFSMDGNIQYDSSHTHKTSNKQFYCPTRFLYVGRFINQTMWGTSIEYVTDIS
jgi:hypothetical protein